MDMIDSALKRLDAMLFIGGMNGVIIIYFLANGSGFVSRLRTKFPNFAVFSRCGTNCSVGINLAVIVNKM